MYMMNIYVCLTNYQYSYIKDEHSSWKLWIFICKYKYSERKMDIWHLYIITENSFYTMSDDFPDPGLP